MVHPDLKGGWHETTVYWPPGSEDTTEMTIGRFKDDQYHLMGYWPTHLTRRFSPAGETNMDLGVVRLPDEKSLLRELDPGEVFEIDPGVGEVLQAEYVRHV
jgi:hypothetical protein